MVGDHGAHAVRLVVDMRIADRTERTGARMTHMEHPTTERSRYAIYRDKKRGTPPPPLAPCGTYAAARRHQRKNEPICAECRVALNARQRAVYARRRTKAS